MAANNSFKPNLLRYSTVVAEKACHAVASTAQVGLTQALGPMSRISAVMLLLLVFSCAMVACVSGPSRPDTTLDIKTGGGVTGPFFAVSLSPSGKLTVKKESLPFSDTKSGLTTDTYDVQLTSGETDQLIALAASVDDFSRGCGLVGHGTTARLWLTSAGKTREFGCDNAPEWPIGPHTQQLMQLLNLHLPERLQVF
ncbi:hypothetical protein [Lysobacter sp. A421]